VTTTLQSRILTAAQRELLIRISRNHPVGRAA
jgi:hypothetical protein